MGSKARACSKCHETHLPPTGKGCMIPEYTELPDDEEGEGGDSQEQKVAKLKAKIIQEQQRIQTTGEILDLEKQLAELRLRHNTLQTERQELLDNLPPAVAVQPADFNADTKHSLTFHTKSKGTHTDTGVSQAPTHSPGHTGLHGFSKPGESDDSEESDSEGSVDSRVSNRVKHKSVLKKREKLLRLNQFTASKKRPKTFEECIAASMGLATKLMDKGYNIRGYLDHLWFMSEQAALCRFRPECILAYDQSVRDKAAARGLEVFTYGDGENFYRHLGSAALSTKKDGKMKTVPMHRYPETKGKATDIKELKICGMYNHSVCPYGLSCFRKHICFACMQGHPRSECPNVNTDQTGSK